MACGGCGGRAANGATTTYEVRVGGSVVTEGGQKNDGKFVSSAEARIWIAQNVKGVAATVRAVRKL